MKYIQLTQSKKAIVDDDDFEWLNQYSWQYDKRSGCALRSVYIRGSGRSNQKNEMWLMHRLVMGLDKTDSREIDHKYGNRLDNRKDQLRVCTHAQNMFNKKLLAKDNSSGFKGVSWHKNSHKWMAKINVQHQQVYLGIFEDIRDAAVAYNKAALKYYGEFARLNELR